MNPNKYELYELSVQSPEIHAEWFGDLYHEVTKKRAYSLREDFCGTFHTSCEWVKRNPKNSAICLDLDPIPLAYGKKKHLAGLSPEQRSRVKVLNKNVLIPTRPGSDLIIACNFSFFIFKQRELLLNYFKNSWKSLNKNGMVILELAGGPGMITPLQEKKEVRLSKTEKFTYIWDQQTFDPITRDAYYAIHFKLSNGKELKNQFTYDWRLWTIPEVREVLADAGFRKTVVYWETEHKGKGTGEYIRMDKGDNSYAWVAYVMGVK